jgi:hypothetical protein
MQAYILKISGDGDQEAIYEVAHTLKEAASLLAQWDDAIGSDLEIIQVDGNKSWDASADVIDAYVNRAFETSGYDKAHVASIIPYTIERMNPTAVRDAIRGLES